MVAAENGHMDVCRSLLDHGANPNLEDQVRGARFQPSNSGGVFVPE